MKIAIFHELHSGGARRTVNEFAKRLKINHTVDLYIVDDKEEKTEKAFFSNVLFYKFFPKEWNGKNSKIRFYKDSVELFKLYKLHKKIGREINKKKYDIILIHPSKYTQAPFVLRFLTIKKAYYCQEPLRLAYDPNIRQNEGLGPINKIYEYLIKMIRKEIDKKNILNADIVLANSKYTKNNIKTAYGINCVVSYLGVDIEMFKSLNSHKAIDILYIGGEEDVDGYQLLEKAIKLMRIKPKIKKQISGENWISDKDLVMLYNNSKIVVCLAVNEPFGLVPLEAMSCGVPVVAVSEGGYRETVLDGDTGYLISRNSKALAEKLELLLINSKKRSEMGKKGRQEVVDRWTWEKSVGNLEKYLSKSQK